jgi:hypothetical protein
MAAVKNSAIGQAGKPRLFIKTSFLESDDGTMSGPAAMPRHPARHILLAPLPLAQHTWVDPAYRHRLLANATAAAKEPGIAGPEGRQMVVVENTADTHNVIVRTQCSCTAWPLMSIEAEFARL